MPYTDAYMYSGSTAWMGCVHYRVSESRFMEFAEVDNHDDFYCVEEGRVHVQDQRGYYVIYDVATEDLKYVGFYHGYLFIALIDPGYLYPVSFLICMWLGYF